MIFKLLLYFTLLILINLYETRGPLLIDSTRFTTFNKPTKPKACPSFNPTFKICCNGVLQDKQGFKSECCNKQVYDPTWNMCCNDVVQKRTGFIFFFE